MRVTAFAKRSVQRYGLRQGVRSTVPFAISWLIKVLLRHWATPSLSELAENSLRVTTCADQFLTHLPGTRCESADLECLHQEWYAVQQALAAESACTPLAHPAEFAVDTETAFVLYTLVRLRGPRTIVETGVANGVSTRVILEALRRNNYGTLFSFDLMRVVGDLVPPALRSRWQFIRLSPSSSQADFGAVLHALPAIDLFLHDSNHSYATQSFEFKSSLGHMAPNSVVCSDDVDASYAFLDFCHFVGSQPLLLVRPAKVFGMLDLPGTEVTPLPRTGSV